VPYKANAKCRQDIPKQRRNLANSPAYEAGLLQSGSVAVRRCLTSGFAGAAEPSVRLYYVHRHCSHALEGASEPRRTCRRQFHNKPRLTSCRRATSAKHAPPSSTSATIRSLSSTRQRRRRSVPVMISIPSPTPVLKGARTNALKNAGQAQDWLGASPRMDTLIVADFLVS
jgi:hypothetical protein